ncbi:MAG: transglycosylase domain-containing protein [Candidatus Kapabacteria bacterium]|nr:transglycosylase domain-containing protein [Candidatus Kapabacteria bacterium]
MLKYLIIIYLTLFVYEAEATLPPIVLRYASYCVSDDGYVISYYGEKNRVEIKYLNQVTSAVTDCLLATEDRDFYQHGGISFRGLGRALVSTLKGSKQGGSTLTMQLARNLFLSNEQTITRKLSEMELARELETSLSKDQILLLYLNIVYFGNGAWGLWAASNEYYSKTPDKLNISEAALLIGLLKNPSGYNPSKFPEKALKRRNDVLHNLVEVGKLSEKEYIKLSKSPINLSLRPRFTPSFGEFIRIKADSILKSKHLNLNDGAFKIYTTLNSKFQLAAEKASADQYKTFPKKLQAVQMGLISIEPGTGKIRAMIGESPTTKVAGLNRSYQIARQLGSSFKPIMYSSMLFDGYTLGTPLLDSELVINPGKAYQWNPENYDKTYTDKDVSMKYAITHSLNVPAVRAITEYTNPERVAEFAEKLGFKIQSPYFPSLALGAYDSNPWRMSAAFSVFASAGTFIEPFAIEKIEDNNWNQVFLPLYSYQSVLDKETCALITNAMQAVVDSGTGRQIRKYYQGVAAGKTGTTSENRDAWFVGYTPELCTAIWLGFDRFAELGGKNFNGGTMAAPIWGRMMGKLQKIFKKDFNVPVTLQNMMLCQSNGYPLDADKCYYWADSILVDINRLQSFKPPLRKK